jgi:hypothetical protein
MSVVTTHIPTESEAETFSNEAIPPRQRLTLRDAVRLSGMSEKTLRRKLEAGLLQGVRENLDYGGFMWMIETRSLGDLYPDSAQLRDYIQLLETQLNQAPEQEPAAVFGPVAAAVQPSVAVTAEAVVKPEPASKAIEEPIASAESNTSASEKGNKDFVLYLLEENRTLKEDVRDKEVRLRNLQERTMQLERECGEQRGTAATQARVLEWFQTQPQAALPAPGQPQVGVETTVVAEALQLSGWRSWSPVRLALVGSLSATALIWLVLSIARFSLV